QVHAGHGGREHEDLPQRHRLWHSRYLRAAQLEGEVLAVGQVRARADGRQDPPQIAAQDAVVVQALDGIQIGLDLLDQVVLGGDVARLGRVAAQLEEPTDIERDRGV